MSRYTKRAVWGTAAMVALSSTAAMGQDASVDARLQELSAKIEKMRADYEQQIDHLRQQLKLIEAQSAAAAAAPAKPAAQAVVRGELPGSIKIPGTETSVKVGGYARLDTVKDLDGGEFGSIAIPSLTPFSGSAQSTRKGQLSMNARQSRLNLRTLTQTSFGPVTTFFEGDFLGAGGNETVTNSSAFRLRHAYVEAGPWLVGQTWTNFVELGSYPETIDFAGGQGVVQGVRAGQVRYTTRWGQNHQLSVAAENPESDIFGTVATTMAAAVGPTSATTLDTVPDINAKYLYTGDWGRIALSGMARHLVFNNTGGAPINGFVGNASTTTGSWAVQGKFKTFGSDSIQYGFASGSGIGRYLLGAVNNTAAVINNGKLDAIQQKGLTAGYQHFWSPTLRSNLIYGAVKSDYPHPAVPLTTPSKVEAFFLNLIWNPIPNAMVGVEWERARVRNDAIPTPALSNTGKNDRLLASFQYGF